MDEMKLPRFKSMDWILIGLLLVFFGFLLITHFSDSSEWWTRMIARSYHVLFAWFYSLIPFSMMEIVFVSWLSLCVVGLFKVVRSSQKKQWLSVQQEAKKTLVVFLTMTNLYLGTAGIAYRRLPVPIPQHQGQVTTASYLDIIDFFIDDFNHQASQLTYSDSGEVENPHSMATLNTLIHTEFEQLDSGYFTAYSTKIKPLLTSFLYREFQIIGVHFAPTTEALINTLIPNALIPFTMAHELAHAKGVMREDDANLVAMYICLNSNDPFIRYSGYFNTFYALLNLTRFMGNEALYGQTLQKLAPQIIRDYQYQQTYWQPYDRLDRFARWVNDTYLRLFGNDGVSSYVDTPQTSTSEQNGTTIDVIASFSPYQKLYFYYYFI
jgi:hypothetical protein